MKSYRFVFLSVTAQVLISSSLVQAALVAHYKLNDTIGSTVAADSSGNGYTAGIWGTSNFTGSSFYFNQTGDGQNYLFTPPNVPALANASFTWALWVRADSTDPDKNGTLIHRAIDTRWEDGTRVLGLRNFDTAFYEYGSNAVSSPLLLWDSTWHHVAITYDQNSPYTVRLYIDGVLRAIQNINLNTAPESIANSFIFGLGNGAGWFRGEMKDIRIYSNILSNTEVWNLAGHTGVPGAALVAYYKLNDAVGSTIVKDSSGNNFNANIWGASNYTGSSFYFNQTGDGQNYMYTPRNMPALANSSFTWALWVRGDNTDPDKNGTLIHRAWDTRWDSGTRVLGLRDFDTAFYVYGESTTASNSQLLWDNTWHHLGVTYDSISNSNCLYIDGVLASQVTVNLKTVPEGADWLFVFGLGNGAGWFKGEMKEIRIYNGLLSATEVAHLAGKFVGDLDHDSDVDYKDMRQSALSWLNDFTTVAGTNSVIENGTFESFDSTTFASHWQPMTFGGGQGTSTLTLLTDLADSHLGSKAMKWEYNNTDPTNAGKTWCEILYTFDATVNLSSQDYIKLWIKRHSGNSQEGLLYLKILDSGLDEWNIAAVSGISESEGSTYANADMWSEWIINLHSMTFSSDNGYFQSANLEYVSGIQLGISDDINKTGGTGTIDVDDISFGTFPVCSSSAVGDLDGNCVVNFMDFAKLAQNWMLSVSNPGI